MICMPPFAGNMRRYQAVVVPPPDSSSFRIWLNPDSIVGKADGDSVNTGELSEQSASAYPLRSVGIAAGAAPLYRTAGPGLQVASVWNSGTSIIQNLSSMGGGLPDADSATYFIVVEAPLPAPGSGQAFVLFDQWFNLSDTKDRIQIGLSDPISGPVGALTLFAYRGAGGGLFGTNVVPSSGRFLITLENNAGAAALRINGVQIVTGTLSGGSGASANGIDIAGKTAAPYYGLNGVLYHVIASDLLGSTLRNDWEGWLMNKYGI